MQGLLLPLIQIANSLRSRRVLQGHLVPEQIKSLSETARVKGEQVPSKIKEITRIGE